ncbi:MAG: SpoIIE family protein phosphatase [Planctomycetota bacterium]
MTYVVDEQPAEGVVPGRIRSRFVAWLDEAGTGMRLAMTGLGKDIRLFSRHMERAVLPQERERREGESSPADMPQMTHESLRLEVDGDVLGSFEHLSEFLSSLGVHGIDCDLNLHSDQIASVLKTLWMTRRYLGDNPLRGHRDPLGRARLARALTGDEELHVACTEPRLDVDKGILRIEYTYCMLTFSRAVNGFMRRWSSFDDHRAFFRAAPRYATLIASVFLLPTLLYVFWGFGELTLLGVDVVLAAIMGLAVYVLFETVGAIQYDKEHQAKLLADKHAELRHAHGHITRDMKRAGRVQQSLIPKGGDDPLPEQVRLAHSYVPQMEVGGDYYDYTRLEDGKLALLFVDVSGHGMAGAFVTGIIKTIFEVAAARAAPAAFMRLVNDMLIRITPPDSFAAMIYGVYDPETRTLTYVNAGHQPTPMLVRAEDGAVEHEPQAGGLAAGFVPDTPYEEMQFTFEPGDRLVLCTDGITERKNPQGEMFGLDRLKELLSSSVSEPIDSLPGTILDRVAEHRDDMPQRDDETILTMEVLK